MSEGPVQTITPQGLEALRAGDQEVDLIDVRTPAEYREVHVAFARNVPLGDLDRESVQGSGNGTADRPLYVMCGTGQRSQAACEKLIRAGRTNVVGVEGGINAWQQAGLSVMRGPKAMSLERQVRIAAGALVLLGLVLGRLVHPYFAGISAFVGGGLIFAGVTDYCGMGILLAKMPWNRGSAGAACSQS